MGAAVYLCSAVITEWKDVVFTGRTVFQGETGGRMQYRTG